MTPFLSGALALGAIALVGCGGGGGSNGPRATATPSATADPNATPTATPLPGTTPTRTPTPAPTSTQTNLILFVSDRAGSNDIYSMLSDGTRQTKLTSSSAADNSPSRARNGARIAFSSERDGNPEIYTMDLSGDTSRLLRLTADMDLSLPDDITPTFSPNGSKIAWVSTRGGASNVWTMDSTGANQVQFTTEGNISSPAYSSNGSEIAYSVVRGGAAVIVAKNVATGSERVLVQGAFDTLAPRYSANGTQLVFTQRASGSSDQGTLRVLNLASGVISDGPSTGSGGSFALTGSFSPDSSRLAFETSGSPAPQIAVSSGLSGTTATVLTSQGRNFSPFWGQ